MYFFLMEANSIVIYDSCFVFKLCTIRKTEMSRFKITLISGQLMLSVQNRYFNTDFNNHAEVLSSPLREATKMVFQNILICVKENFSYQKIYSGHLFSLIFWIIYELQQRTISWKAIGVFQLVLVLSTVLLLSNLTSEKWRKTSPPKEKVVHYICLHRFKLQIEQSSILLAND